MSKVKFTTETTVDVTVEQLAEMFCALDDDAQSKFFVECARIMRTWGNWKAQMQEHYIGHHLATCSCSTEDGRTMLRNIVKSMDMSAQKAHV